MTEIANLVMYALLTAPKMHQRKHGRTKKTYLLVDEFQRMATGESEAFSEDPTGASA